MLTDPQKFLKSLPNQPGVYQMYDAEHKVLYVGKAKNLAKRLRSYFAVAQDTKTLAFMTQVQSIEVILTASENAALLLESNLIKTLQPRYNILFKDDKSFPYLLLSCHEFPRLSIYRGATNKLHGKYFGPFPSGKAVKDTVNLLQKIFRLRVCSDTFLRHRTRPCMLYQIKLCNAPCVGKIDSVAYAAQVKLVEQFLANKSDYIVQEFTKLMDAAAARLDYEQAANYRDQIVSMRKVQRTQEIIKASGNIDVIALVTKQNAVCIDVLFIRNGLVLGNKSYFPASYQDNLSPAEIVTTFLMQHYHCNENEVVVPDKILSNVKLANRLACAILLQEKFKRKITIVDRVRNTQKHLLTMAVANATNALRIHCANSNNYFSQLLAFQATFQLAVLPRRIECFDVSHMLGEAQIASCVVFTDHGPRKSDYRRYNIKTTKVGDDYRALLEALSRRYSAKKNLPDVIMVDGGKGQLNIAVQVLRQLQLEDILLLAIAKGQERKPGLEEIYIEGRVNPIILAPQSATLHLIQQIRDEAHRFALSGHRKKMLKIRRHSILADIAGIGKAKQVRLLKHFGGLTELQSAGIDDLQQVTGIGYDLARRIYEHLHAE